MNDELLKILPYSKTFKAGIINLIVDIQRNEFGIPITAEDQPDLLNIPDYYQNKNGNFWVALHKERVVGTIALLDIGNRQGALRKMFVHHLFRGEESETAKMLLNELLNWTEEKDFREIYLGTTAKFLAAHRFYEKNRFLEIKKEDLPDRFPIMTVDTKFYKLNMPISNTCRETPSPG
jgi:N-acetylglutamate synthase-like GNAT family acetyltransferase